VISFLIDVFADAHAEFMAEARAQERADLMLKHASLMRALDALSEQIDLSPTESEILWDEQMEALHTTAVLLAKDFLARVREAEEKIIDNGSSPIMARRLPKRFTDIRRYPFLDWNTFMARFFSTDAGEINLDHVVRARDINNREGQRQFVFYGTDGGRIGEITYPTGWLSELLAPIVAAAPGMVAVVITPHSEAGIAERPHMVLTERLPIVGWRIVYDTPVPILLETPIDKATVFIELPDGALVAPDDFTASDIADAERVVLMRAQAEWDRKQAQKPDNGATR